MSKFEVKCVKIRDILPIEGSDFIEIALIGDYKSVVRKGQFKQGDLAAYIPESSIVPEWLLKRMGLEGKLAGAAKNRVKAVKLRGVLSQGLLYGPAKFFGVRTWLNTIDGGYYLDLEKAGFRVHAVEGTCLAEDLGIRKYEPTIPTSMAGEVFSLGTEYTVNYDIENIKKYPNVLSFENEIVVTEKLHGTFTGIGYSPELYHRMLFGPAGQVFTFSKGLGAKGLVFKNNENNDNNVYVKNLRSQLNDPYFETTLRDISKEYDNATVLILGEIFGKGVQDLTYGFNTPTFRVFDVYIKNNEGARYLNVDEMLSVAKRLDFKTVPFLYRGPFDRMVIDDFSKGSTTLTDNQIKEGVVVKPTTEMRTDELGRVILKHVGEQYLLRGEGTEFN